MAYLSSAYDLYQQVLDQKTSSEIFRGVFYYIYLFSKHNIIHSKHLQKGNLVRLLKVTAGLEKSLDFFVLEPAEAKEKSYYLGKLKWFIQVMTWSDDQFIHSVKSNGMKFSDKKLKTLLERKQLLQRKRVDSERVAQLMDILQPG